ncbi:hypothetical protein [Streptomyces sp. ODS28]|uniref:hypothetical protein n=1 Tax=Streptomyces sp. ODS28 TaxID=3136688 RepID=UPI0031EAD88E
MGFNEVADPTAHLTTPDEPEEAINVFQPVDDAGEAFTPGVWLNEVYGMVFGYDPVERAQEFLAGDWKSYARCGAAWGRLGAACQDLSQNISTGNSSLDATWDGNAADAAFVYFKTIAERCDGLKSELDSLQNAYESISQAVSVSSELAATGLSQIEDSATVVAISAAAGELTSWTGWGAAVGYGIAAVEILRMVKLWGDVTGAIGTAESVAQTTVLGITLTSKGVADTFHNFPLPGDPYNHPAA